MKRAIIWRNQTELKETAYILVMQAADVLMYMAEPSWKMLWGLMTNITYVATDKGFGQKKQGTVKMLLKSATLKAP